MEAEAAKKEGAESAEAEAAERYAEEGTDSEHEWWHHEGAESEHEHTDSQEVSEGESEEESEEAADQWACVYFFKVPNSCQDKDCEIYQKRRRGEPLVNQEACLQKPFVAYWSEEL